MVGPFAIPCVARTLAMVTKSVAFVTPYSQTNPYRRSAELKAPRRKYLIAASFAKRSVRWIPAST